MPASRNNRCKGREAGCLWKRLFYPAEAEAGATRCKVCRAAHNAREAKRREARRQQCQCWVCGAVAVQVAGVYQATCLVHVHYRREVSA